MKSFAALIVILALAVSAQAQQADKNEQKINQMSNEQMRQMNANVRQMAKEQAGDNMLGSAYGAPAGYAAPPKAAYGAPAPAYPSVPAPPCPRNYLFSCQPQLTPAPCAQAPSASYGSAGAYSHYVPQYALPAPTYQY